MAVTKKIAADSPPKAEDKPWRVSHPNKDCVAGFDTERDAKDDTAARNAVAVQLGLDIRYGYGPRPRPRRPI